MEAEKMTPKPPAKIPMPDIPKRLAMPELEFKLDGDSAYTLNSIHTREQVVEWVLDMMPWPLLPKNWMRLVVATAYDLIVMVLLNAAGKMK